MSFVLCDENIFKKKQRFSEKHDILHEIHDF